MTQNWDSSGSGDTGSQPAAPPTGGAPEGYPAYAPGYPPVPGFVPPPGYPAPGAPPAGYGYPPGYQPPFQQVPGYPPTAGYPGYVGPPPLPLPPAVPGNVRAAAVLAFVQSGLVILLGLISISGADDSDTYNGLDFYHVPSSDSLIIMGLLAVIAGGLLIAGGVQAPRRKSVLLLVGSGLSLALSVWWLVATDFDDGVLIWALILAAMPIISASLISGQTARQWMANKA